MASDVVTTFNALLPNVAGANTGKIVWTSLWADMWYRGAIRRSQFTPNAPPNRVFIVNKFDVVVSSDYNNWKNPPPAAAEALPLGKDQTSPPLVANGDNGSVNFTGFYATATITRVSTDENIPVRAVFQNITPDADHRQRYIVSSPGNFFVASENIGYYQAHDADTRTYQPRQGNAGVQGIPYSTTLEGGNVYPCGPGFGGQERILSCVRNLRDMDIIFKFDPNQSSNCKITYSDIW